MTQLSQIEEWRPTARTKARHLAEESPPRRHASLLVTDLDNTLWDWFFAWHESFAAMLDRLVVLSGVPRETLISEIRAVHQRVGTAEYSNLLNELPSLLSITGGRRPLKVFDEAVHVLNSKRKKSTALYPGVLATLTEIRSRGIPIVAYTESLAYWTEWRIRFTELDGVIDVLYSAPDHDLPAGSTFRDLRWRGDDEYGLRRTEHRHVQSGVLKPDQHILERIIADQEVPPDHIVYVGDSLMKDVAMAQQVGVIDVHAKYGVVTARPEYDLLRAVTHWTDVNVARERVLATSAEITPSYVLNSGFSELLDLFDFRRTDNG